MVIARKAERNESEEFENEPLPKRKRLDDGSYAQPEKMFASEFNTEYVKMCADLKARMKANKQRLMPNSKELVVNFNTRMQPEIISEHNDPMRVDWTEVPKGKKAEPPNCYTGWEALRVPDDSEPRYKLFWPIQHGWFNEKAYDSKRVLLEDISTIFEEAIKKHLGLSKKREWSQYGCILVIPDLYEREYVTAILDMLMRELGFGRVAFIQEGLAATYGAGYSTACVVDIGAQKTSVCCVEDGLCIENSRVNVKLGGMDVTDAFLKMMLYDHFPYADINLRRRYDWVLADELKRKHATQQSTEVTVQLADFHVRAPSQDTRKYQFKTYDETFLAAYGLFQPSIFDHAGKLQGRHSLIGPSQDLYESSRNDPTSTAQSDIVTAIAPHTRPSEPTASNGAGAAASAFTFSRPLQSLQRVATDSEAPNSNIGSPAPEGDGTPAPADPMAFTSGGLSTANLPPCLRDDVLPIAGIDTAILTSIAHGARGDERKSRDFLGGIMVVGGGSLVPGMLNALEDRLKLLRPGYAKDIMVGAPPRELDPQVVPWKGGSVLGKLNTVNEVWIGRLEWDRLGNRVLVYKCLWQW